MSKRASDASSASAPARALGNGVYAQHLLAFNAQRDAEALARAGAGVPPGGFALPTSDLRPLDEHRTYDLGLRQGFVWNHTTRACAAPAPSAAENALMHGVAHLYGALARHAGDCSAFDNVHILRIAASELIAHAPAPRAARL